jgi:hypothetical protein
MALPLFQSFYPTVVRWLSTAWRHEYKVIVDNNTGAPIGLVSPSANGPEGIWAPTPISSAQLASPTAAMLADLNATFQLNQAPYSRYISDGVQLVPLGGSSEGGTLIPPGINVMWVAPLTIFANEPLTIEGGVILVAGV